MLTMWLVVWMQ